MIKNSKTIECEKCHHRVNTWHYGEKKNITGGHKWEKRELLEEKLKISEQKPKHKYRC